MPYLRTRWSQTHNWSRSLPHKHASHRSPVILIPRRWLLPSTPCAASHSKTDKTFKSTNDWPHKIYVSDRVTDRKSVFQAHATELPDTTMLPTFLGHLTSLPSLKRATHCMYAYRSTQKIQGQEKLACGQSDGGESGSGDRLSRLLELSNCDNVIVVVSRWYGGINLGSDRWKRISDVAKEALGEGGFMKRGALQQEKAKKRK